MEFLAREERKTGHTLIVLDVQMLLHVTIIPMRLKMMVPVSFHKDLYPSMISNILLFKVIIAMNPYMIKSVGLHQELYQLIH